MNSDLPRLGGLLGRSCDRYGEQPHQDSSTFSKVQQQYWTTKQAVFQKLGKKEDEHVVASDLQLDTKLELFLSIQESSAMLQKTIELYQDKLLALSHEENALGRFLKDNGKADKTRAGKMMLAVGKTMSYASQQRLAIRVPLVRLHQEVETFRCRAISDTLVTVNQMETARTDYRGALLWMKDVSQVLDPDTYKQLEKFRKVQSRVRKTKGNFEKYKLDCLQKIDLLAASRCNMFSHALATYQNMLLHFWDKTCHTMTGVAESFKGYQYYEFSMLKELTEVGKKIADDTGSSSAAAPFLRTDGEPDNDGLIFFEEYHDEEEQEKESDLKKSKSDSLQNLLHSPNMLQGDKAAEATKKSMDEPLLQFNLDSQSSLVKNEESHATTSSGPKDLLTNNPEIDDMEKDDMTLLNEILSTEVNPAKLMVFNQQWDSMFNAAIENNSHGLHDDTQDFLPSQLLKMQQDISGLNLLQEEGSKISNSNLGNSVAKPSSTSTSSNSNHSKRNPSKLHSAPSKKTSTKDMTSWFNLFSELDPLANPDAIGKPGGAMEGEDDRNC